ncbi:MAG TPA: glycoside hydrolase family 2 TIM barrel-domain containing protein [Tepidisphaeraceae bacterium]|nr:glycoside hydrolase family 2 TIM barrel-domain containing protein [Tepidisphaeraceae bacterium]
MFRPICRDCVVGVLIVWGLVLSAPVAHAADYVWVEGEQPASANVKWNNAGSSHADWLSNGHWLTIAINAENIEKATPADGVILEYKLPVKTAGKYELWARLGFEFAPSNFQWKLDGGELKAVSHDELTRDAMELDFFAEAAWLKLGDPQLTIGEHIFTIRIPREKRKDGKFEQILFGLDAICLSKGPFTPHSRYKPDEAWRTARDEQAAKQTYALPAPKAAGVRSSVVLTGLWEICGDEEELPGPVAEPIKATPQHAFWGAIQVPGDRNELRPDLLFAHRFWYRTKVIVPKEAARRSFFLTFPQNNLNTTVYVNGIYCGFNKNPFARFDIDISKGIKAGEANVIQIGVRDAWYGRSYNPADPMKLRRTFNLPTRFFNDGFQDLAYPVWSHAESGILQPVTLTAAGGAYAADVFVKTSVAHKQLALEITLANPAHRSAPSDFECQVLDPDSGQIAKSIGRQPIQLDGKDQQVAEVAADWADPKLWWPDSPHMYILRTTLRQNGQIVDVSDTPFGFREWSIDGIHFKLNGVPFHGWCDQHFNTSPDSWLAFQRKTHQQMMRFWGTTWLGLSPDDALNFFDKNGVVVRRSGMLDGEAIGYHADEPDPALRKLYNNSPIKMDLMQNWRDQVVAQVKGERNHPSVMIWSIENEWLFINCINLYGGLMDDFEREETLTSKAVQAVDPTRPTMSDGGAACLAQTLPVCGNHYITGKMPEYPTLAYSPNVTGGGRGRWVWDQKRPRFAGEDWFIAGNHPELAAIGGEAALTGKSGLLPAAGLMTRILQEGYRWDDYGAWDFWMNSTDADGSQYIAFAPRAALCREWNFTFGSGEQAKRTIAIYNDTHEADPITFAWSLTIGGKNLAGASKSYSVAPGTQERMVISFALPIVQQRTEGELLLTLATKGKEVFRDSKAVSVLPALAGEVKATGITRLKQGELAVFDPTGVAGDFLKRQGVAFTSMLDLKSLPPNGKVLLIGKDALDHTNRASSALAAWASSGRAVIVLEQKEPLEYQAIPAEMEPASNLGRVAFIEDASHPALAGLQSKDFFTWGDDEIVYRDAYAKPTRGAKSLIECDELLKNSALVEVPVEKGLLLLCQLTLEEKLAKNAAAQQLLFNLIHYGATYKQTFRPTTLTASPDSQLVKVAQAIGLTYQSVAEPLTAIAKPGEKVAVIEATPANLAALSEHPDTVSDFTQAGGWIVLHGLTPEDLESYNKIVGFAHMIRKFKRERVTFPAVRSPLTAGIPAGDVAMYSSKRIFPWQDGEYVVDDEFSYCVDYDEVAPFAKSSFFAFDNITNGFINADGWPLIINWPIPTDGSLPSVPMVFPREQAITEFTWIGNTNYLPQTKVNLIFSNDKAKMLSFDTQPNGEPQTFVINPPRAAEELTLQIAGWQEKPNTGHLIGIDNIYLKAQRPPAFYKNVRQMLNVGGMMEYPRDKGGIVLCNLLFKDQEEVAVNAIKKRSIFATLLRNLKAPFTGGGSVIVGANVAFAPVDISKQANQYRTDRGWFGDRKQTFAEMPVGRQSFAGVPYDVFEFATSPVPTVIMLGGPGIPNHLPQEVVGIPVHRKADALFFLQAARIDRRRNEEERKQGKPFEMARYFIHYADGKTAHIPIRSETDVENYAQENPRPLPGAQIAWERKYEGTPMHAVAYSQQWNNPRPDVQIATIDLVYGKDKGVAVPALLAITAATRK